MYNSVWYFCTYPYGLSFNGWHSLLCIANNRHHNDACNWASLPYLDDDGETTYETPKFLRLTLKYTLFVFIGQRDKESMRNTLIVVDRYLRLMGDKTIPDSAEPRLESFYPPFVAGIDLPHQGVVDSYNPSLGMRQLFGDVTMGQRCHNQPT